MQSDSLIKQATKFLGVFVLFCIFSRIKQVNAQSDTSRSDTYYCDSAYHSEQGEVPATILNQASGKFPIIYWVNSLGNINPETRCEKVSQNLQGIYDQGIINREKYLRTGTVNSSPVICIVNNREKKCQDNSHIIVTLKPGTDADNILNILTDYNYALKKDPGRLTDRIRFYREGEALIDLELFIERVYLEN
ncbi:MAG: COP23 domain-containing protein [Cyanobacteria bacterium J06621_8]